MRNLRDERLGEERMNYQGCVMKIVDYNTSVDIVVEFQDEYKYRAHTNYRDFKNGKLWNKFYRMGETNINSQGDRMKIVGYETNMSIVVEFQDDYKSRVNSSYANFLSGNVINPYHPTICGVGIIGNKYSCCKNKKTTKEYYTWTNMLLRCFDEKYKQQNTTYKDAICCESWLLYENFYEWLHQQDNFVEWYNGDRWAIDKDILIKGNKVYSPETCCLVPCNVNVLFVAQDNRRGSLPVGVRMSRDKVKFQVECNNPFDDTHGPEYIGTYNTKEEAFYAYKKRKEEIIKQVALSEYTNGNITKNTYDAMMRYEIEITD